MKPDRSPVGGENRKHQRQMGGFNKPTPEWLEHGDDGREQARGRSCWKKVSCGVKQESEACPCHKKVLIFLLTPAVWQSQSRELEICKKSNGAHTKKIGLLLFKWLSRAQESTVCHIKCSFQLYKSRANGFHFRKGELFMYFGFLFPLAHWHGGLS